MCRNPLVTPRPQLTAVPMNDLGLLQHDRALGGPRRPRDPVEAFFALPRSSYYPMGEIDSYAFWTAMGRHYEMTITENEPLKIYQELSSLLKELAESHDTQY